MHFKNGIAKGGGYNFQRQLLWGGWVKFRYTTFLIPLLPRDVINDQSLINFFSYSD